MNIRKTIVSGSFYPADKTELNSYLSTMMDNDNSKIDVFSVISPHAGYVYSGKTAASVFSKILIPNNVIVLSPNHSGLGPNLSLDSNDKWSTPLGEIDINKDLINEINKQIEYSKIEPYAQQSEHALEVQLPFMQHINPHFKLTPITISGLDYKDISETGKTLAKIIYNYETTYSEKILIVASNDMTHFEDSKTAKTKDDMALKMIEKKDTLGLLNVVYQNNISMCGIYPVSIMLEAIKEYEQLTRKNIKSNIVNYTNSAEVTKDHTNVVAYAGLYFVSK